MSKWFKDARECPECGNLLAETQCGQDCNICLSNLEEGN